MFDEKEEYEKIAEKKAELIAKMAECLAYYVEIQEAYGMDGIEKSFHLIFNGEHQIEVKTLLIHE